jgi:glycine dehydrogenase subunit 1
VDIVAGEGQSLGIPISFGGLFLGLFATRQAYVRQMPGRLVGETMDGEGRRGYVLTVTTREQHIRRAKATSNICTNEGLCALRAAVYLSTLGRQGLRELAIQNVLRAERAKGLLREIPGLELPFSAPTFNEFVVRVPAPASRVSSRLRQAGILGGLDLGRWYPEFRKDPEVSHPLFCVTEQNPPEAVEALVGALRGVGAQRERVR